MDEAKTTTKTEDAPGIVSGQPNGRPTEPPTANPTFAAACNGPYNVRVSNEVAACDADTWQVSHHNIPSMSDDGNAIFNALPLQTVSLMQDDQGYYFSAAAPGAEGQYLSTLAGHNKQGLAVTQTVQINVSGPGIEA